MRKIFKISFLSAMFLANQAIAGIFGPSNFEECVLENLKNAKNELAVQAVYSACGDKFNKPTKPSKEIAEDINKHMFTGLHQSRPTLFALINKIEVTAAQIQRGSPSSQMTHTLNLNLTNRNDFLVEAVSIGILKSGKKSCSWEDQDYAEFYVCIGNVGGYGSGSMECNIPNVNNRPSGWKYCVTGLGFSATESDKNKFMKKYSIPPLKR